MKSLNMWMDEYSESHQNQINSRIHFICVPTIMFSLLGLLIALKAPYWAFGLFLLGCLAFYFKLSLRVGFLMSFLLLGMLSILFYLEYSGFGYQGYLIIFILAWIGQFIGHKIEGKKPSFFKDLQFLLIGPIWVLRKFKFL